MGVYKVVNELVPDDQSGFQWSSYEYYSQQTVLGVESVSDYIDLPPFELSPDSLLNPPLIAQMIGMQGTLEYFSGLPWGELVTLAGDIYALATATSPAAIVQGIAKVLDTALNLITTIAKQAEVAGDAISAIPILGQIAGTVLGAVSLYFESKALMDQYAAQCDKLMAHTMDIHCRIHTQNAMPSQTGGGGLLPSDLFRPLAYSLQLGRLHANAGNMEFPRIPLNVTALYVLLCGGEATEVGQAHGGPVLDHKGFAKLRSDYVSATGKDHIGVPKHVQAQMWQLIKAIISATESPGLKESPQSIGDRGRSLWPALQDIVRNLWIAGKTGSRGYGIDKGFLTVLQDHLLAVDHMWTYTCKDLMGDTIGGPAGAKIVSGTCKGRVDLVTPFEASIIQYEKTMFDEYRPNGEWILSPKSMSKNPLAGLPEVSMALPGSIADTLTTRIAGLYQSVGEINAEGGRNPLSSARASAAASGSGGASGGAVALGLGLGLGMLILRGRGKGR